MVPPASSRQHDRVVADSPQAGEERQRRIVADVAHERRTPAGRPHRLV
jgi:hypothetical protein